MSSKKNKIPELSFVDLSGQTEDVSNMPVGVSNRFEDEKFREMTRKRLMEKGGQQKFVHEEASKQMEEKARTTSKKTDKILQDITGTTGSYAVLPISDLVPTPEAWNQFSSISNEKKVLMADSIYRNGLQQPIVVRAMDEDRKTYQILSGNTRKSIYEVLYDLTQDKKYLSIECKVYGYKEITDDQAREIASDTNYVQRANLTGRDKSFAVRTKLDILKKRGEKQILEKVASQMGMKRTATFCWNKMANLIPAFFDLYDEGRISQNVATRIAAWPHDVQEEIYKKSDQITEEIIMAIPAKTPSQIVTEIFAKLVEENHRKAEDSNRIGYIKSLKEEKDGYTLHLSGKAPKTSQIVIMYLPEKKAKAIQKRYKEYIIEPPEEQE